MELDYLKQMTVMDTQTLDKIMNLYGNDIWNYAYFLTKQQALADDIAQDVFIKAYFGIHTFRGQASLKRGRHDHTTNRVPVQKAFSFGK